MNLQEMFAKMSSGEVQAHSELGTRDESKQVRNFGTRIQKLKTVTNINARLLVMKDVVLPFNPFTCEPDETYNRSTPFRPILLVSQVIEGIKEVVLKDDNLKKRWKNEYNIEFTEGPATMDEYNAFKQAKFIYPRVMTYHTIALNFGGLCGFSEFRQKFVVDPAGLNDEGTYDYGPGAPIWHQAAVFFNGMLRPEAEEKKKKLEENNATKTQIDSERRAVFSKSPVGFVGPTNLIPFFYFPYVDGVKKFSTTTPKDIEASLRFYSFTDKFTVPLSEALGNPMYDSDIDFFDLTIKTPSSKETKSNGQVYTDDDSMELYTAMQIINTDGRLALHGGTTMVGNNAVKNEEAYESFMATAKAYFAQSQEESMTEGGETFEKIMAASNRFRRIDTVLDNFLPACNEVFKAHFAQSPYLTEEFKKANATFFTAMNPANAMALADSDDDEIEEAEHAQAKSVAELVSMAAPKEQGDDLTSLEFDED